MGLFDIFKKNKKEKVTINDDVFGNLMLIEEGWIKGLEMKLFNKIYDVDLIVESDENDEKSISENQKNSYIKYMNEQKNIKSEVEKIIIEKYDFMEKSEIVDSRPLSIHFNINGSVKLICSIDEDGIEMVEFELLPLVKFNQVL